jgi:hypothetical protein
MIWECDGQLVIDADHPGSIAGFRIMVLVEAFAVGLPHVKRRPRDRLAAQP